VVVESTVWSNLILAHQIRRAVGCATLANAGRSLPRISVTHLEVTRRSYGSTVSRLFDMSDKDESGVSALQHRKVGSSASIAVQRERSENWNT
jgi:hypothetical protein